MTTETENISFFQETFAFILQPCKHSQYLGRGQLNQHTKNIQCGGQGCTSEQMRKECSNGKEKSADLRVCLSHRLLSVSSHPLLIPPTHTGHRDVNTKAAKYHQQSTIKQSYFYLHYFHVSLSFLKTCFLQFRSLLLLL